MAIDIAVQRGEVRELVAWLRRLGATDDRAKRAADMLAHMDTMLNEPAIHEFNEAVAREAAHQRNRWGTEHDAGKEPEDWLWLVGYLTTKAVMAHRYGDSGKYFHHIVTAAAALSNWFAHEMGQPGSMKPGASDKTMELADGL